MFMKEKLLVTFTISLFVTSVLYSQYDYFTIDTLGKKLACDSITLVFTGSSLGSVNYSWDFGNGTTSTQIKDTITYFPGTYKIIYFNSPFTDSATIVVNQTPTAAFTDSIVPNTGFYSRIFIDQSIKDTINNPLYSYTIDYDDGTDYTGSTISLIKKFPKEETYHIIMIIKDQLTCADTAEIDVKITDQNLQNLPNSFTPNNDGINDLFVIEGDGITLLKFEVFNRAGSIIYQNESKIITWDGKTLSGMDAPTGVYFYILTSENNKYEVVNSIFLIRNNN